MKPTLSGRAWTGSAGCELRPAAGRVAAGAGETARGVVARVACGVVAGAARVRARQGLLVGEQEREIAGFCLGAFKDALCLRRMERRARTPLALSIWRGVAVPAVACRAAGSELWIGAVVAGRARGAQLVACMVRRGLVLIEYADNEDSPREDFLGTVPGVEGPEAGVL